MKREKVFFCLLAAMLVLALFAFGIASAENDPIRISIPLNNPGAQTAYTFTFEKETISSFEAEIHAKGSDIIQVSKSFSPDPSAGIMMWIVDGCYRQPGDYTAVVHYYDVDGTTRKTLTEDYTIASGEQPSKPVLNTSDNTMYYNTSKMFTLSNMTGFDGYVAYQSIKKGTDWGNAPIKKTECYSFYEGPYLTIDDTSNGTGIMDYQIRVSLRERNQSIWSSWSDPYDVKYIYYGALPEPVITVASGKTAGQDIPFSIVCDNAEHFSGSLYRQTENSEEFLCSLDDINCRWEGNSGTIMYPKLDAGTYRMAVQASAERYSSSGSSAVFTVGSGTRPEGPAVTLNDGGNVYEESNLEIKAALEGLDRLYYEILHADGSLYTSSTNNYPAGSDEVKFRTYLSSVGGYTFKAWGHANGKWTSAAEKSFVVQEKQVLSEPEVTLSKETLQPGENLILTVEDDPLVGSYDYSIERIDQEGNSELIAIEYPDRSTGLTFTVEGYHFMEEGSYEITFSSRPKDQNAYIASSTKKTLTVAGTLQTGPKMTQPSEKYINENTEFSFSLSGATDLRVRYYQDAQLQPAVDDFYGSNTVSGNGMFTWSYGFRDEGNWGIRVAAKRNGRWTDWGDLVTFTVTVRGTLANPDIQLPDGEIAAGHDLNLTYTLDSRASYGYFSLYQKVGSWDSQLFSQYLYEADGSFTLEGQYLSPGQYKIEISFGASGYRDVSDSVEITVTGEPAAGPTVTLNKESYLRGEQMLVTLDRTYDAICALGDGVSRVFVGRSSFIWNASIYGNSMTLSVKTQTNGEWSEWTKTGIPLISRGSLKEPEITVLKAVVGEDVQIQVEDIEEADFYFINVNTIDTKYVGEIYSTNGGVFTFDESLFSSGEYQVSIWIGGAGYSRRYAHKTFAVTGSRAAALPTVTASAATVYHDDPVTFYVSAPGASVVRMREGDEDYRFDQYTVTNGQVKITVENIQGEQSFYFSARTNGAWSDWTEPIVIIQKDSEQAYPTTLSKPVISLSPMSQTVGNDLKVSMQFDAGTEHYELRLRNEKDGALEDPYTASGAVVSGAQAEITIPGTELSRSGSYILEVWANGTNVNSGYTKQKISVAGQTIYKPAPTVDWGDIPEDTVCIGEEIELTVSSEEGEISEVKISYTAHGYYDAEYAQTWNNLEPNSVQEGSFYVPNYALGQDLNLEVSAKIDGVWSATTDRIFHVCDAHSKVTVPAVTLNKTSVTAGEPISVTWPLMDSAAVSRVKVHWCQNPSSAIGQYETNWLPANAVSYTLSTEGLSSGIYYVYVDLKLQDGYALANSTHIFAPFHVKEPATGDLRTLTLPAALKTIDEEAFAGTNAQKIVLPSGCTSIGSKAFAFSDNLSVVVIPASVTSIAEDAFLGCEDVTIETTRNSAAASYGTAHGMTVTEK